MPNIDLTFHLKLKDGRKMEQKISVPADGDGEKTPTPEMLIMQMLTQYATVGMLKRDPSGNKFILQTAGTIDNVEVEIPTIVTPTTSEFAKSLLS